MIEEINKNPEMLLNFDFYRIEENTTDPLRWVWYRKLLSSSDSCFYIEFEFEHYITDYHDTNNFLDYTLNDMYILISDDILTNYRYTDLEVDCFGNGFTITKHPVKIKDFKELCSFLTHANGFFSYL